MPFFDNLKSFVPENLAKSLNQAQHKFMDEDIRATLGSQEQIILPNKVGKQYQRLIDLARVDAALERLENGTFGICIGCGIEMDLEVLTQDPAVAKCSFCGSATGTLNGALRPS